MVHLAPFPHCVYAPDCLITENMLTALDYTEICDLRYCESDLHSTQCQNQRSWSDLEHLFLDPMSLVRTQNRAFFLRDAGDTHCEEYDVERQPGTYNTILCVTRTTAIITSLFGNGRQQLNNVIF